MTITREQALPMAVDPMSSTFAERIVLSEPARLLVGNWLRDRGHTVLIPHLSMSGPDVGDLLVIRSGANCIDVVEVKHISRSFTSRETWPFKDFIVDAKRSYDEKRVKPYAYICLSHDNAAVAMHLCVPDRWRVEDRKGREYYVAALDDVIFMALR